MPAREQVKIGLFLSRISGRYSAAIWPFVVETARRMGADVILFPEERWRVSHSLADSLDALILLSGDLSLRFRSDEFARFLGRFASIPRVHVSMDLPGEHSCGIDNRSGIRDAVRHVVLTHGIREIAFLRGPEIHQEACQRFAVYKEALAELGIPFRPEYVYDGDFFKETGERALEAFLDLRGLPLKAVLCSNDAMALGLIEAALARGLSVPRDLIVLGFDDTNEALSGRVALTTVRQPYRKIAERATQEAIALARGRVLPPAEPFPTLLMVRNSCGCYSDGIRAISLRPLPPAEAPGKGEAIESWKPAVRALAVNSTSLSGLPDEARSRLALGLLDAYCSIDAEDGRFLEEVAACLEAEISSGGNPSVWHEALGAIGNSGFPLAEGGFARSAGLRRAHVLVEEANGQFRMRESEKQYQNQRNADKLVSRILSDLGRGRLAELLLAELPKAGVGSAVVALYDRSADSLEAESGVGDRRLSVLCAYGRSGKALPEGLDYPASEMFPPGFHGPGPGGDFVLMPLRHANEEYGIILQEVRDPFEGIGYDTIGQQIGAAFKRILMEEERQAARSGLEAALASLKEANEKLLGLSREDELTGLLNRRGFMEDAERDLALARRMGAECALFFMDMDGLKDINDTHGHDSGDAALRGFASILGESFRATDTVSRLGGDEFVAFSFMGAASAPAMIDRIEAALADFNAGNGAPWHLSTSIGVAEYDPERHPGLEDLLKDADADCYRSKAAKRRGGARPASP